MNSFGDFFQNFKNVGFKKIKFKEVILIDLEMEIL
jgi:hypothetical protein